MSTQEPKDYPLEAYKLLFGMLQHEESLFWGRTQAFLVINAAMFTIVGLIRPKEIVTVSPPIRVLSVVICIFGALVCLLWWIIVRRSEAFYDHWYEQLKFLEKQYLSPINIFQTAEEYFATGQIQIGEQLFKLGPIAKRLRIYLALTVVPIILIVGWILLAVYLVMWG